MSDLITPEELCLIAQGCERSERPWDRVCSWRSTPNGVVSSRRNVTEPFQGSRGVLHSRSQGSRDARQTWAMGCNSFGVKTVINFRSIRGRPSQRYFRSLLGQTSLGSLGEIDTERMRIRLAGCRFLSATNRRPSFHLPERWCSKSYHTLRNEKLHRCRQVHRRGTAWRCMSDNENNGIPDTAKTRRSRRLVMRWEWR